MSNQDLLQEAKSLSSMQTGTTIDNDDDVTAIPLTITQKVEMHNCMRQFIEEKGMESTIPTLKVFEKSIFSQQG